MLLDKDHLLYWMTDTANLFLISTEAASGEGAAPVGVHNLVLEQVRILDEEGIMKVVYPARNDLLSEAFRVIRDYD